MDVTAQVDAGDGAGRGRVIRGVLTYAPHKFRIARGECFSNAPAN